MIMENEFKGVVSDIKEAMHKKQWDEVRRLYEKYKNDIPPLTIGIDSISDEDFERLKKSRGLHILVTPRGCKNEVKNSMAILFSDAYPYMMGWYNI